MSHRQANVMQKQIMIPSIAVRCSNEHSGDEVSLKGVAVNPLLPVIAITCKHTKKLKYTQAKFLLGLAVDHIGQWVL